MAPRHHHNTTQHSPENGRGTSPVIWTYIHICVYIYFSDLSVGQRTQKFDFISRTTQQQKVEWNNDRKEITLMLVVLWDSVPGFIGYYPSNSEMKRMTTTTVKARAIYLAKCRIKCVLPPPTHSFDRKREYIIEHYKIFPIGGLSLVPPPGVEEADEGGSALWENIIILSVDLDNMFTDQFGDYIKLWFLLFGILAIITQAQFGSSLIIYEKEVPSNMRGSREEYKSLKLFKSI